MSDENPYAQPQDPSGRPVPPPAGPYGQPAYGYPHLAPGMYTGDPTAPYGYDIYGRPYSDKSKIVAGILQFFVGTFGIGRFYTGHIGIALGQLFTRGGFGIWALIDGIILLTGNPTDSEGRVLRG